MKVLYIEDQSGETIIDNLERIGVEVKTNSADQFNDTLAEIQNPYDAYLMDFRLTANKGLVDAPTYATTIRGGKVEEHPIILISNDKNLAEFEKDFTSQDLFDIVISKKSFNENITKYCNRISDLVESYKLIKNSNFNISKTLGLESYDELDFRLIDKLQYYAESKSIYGFCRTIYYSLVRGCGYLIGTDMVAARFGIDKECEDFHKFLEFLNPCKYTGIMSKSYDRWWAYKVIDKWEELSSLSLRRLEAAKRVEILNEKLGLQLIPAKALELSNSTTFWTICSLYKCPLDPAEGYLYNLKELDVWQEPEYISLLAALEYPELQQKLSRMDQKEIREFGNATSQAK